MKSTRRLLPLGAHARRALRACTLAMLFCAAQHAHALPPNVCTGDVIISEFAAATSDQLVHWTDDGRPRLGIRTPWTDIAYHDAAWKAARGGFGQGGQTAYTTPIATLGKCTSFYMRQLFVASPGDAQRSDDVLLYIDFQRAFVAYLNGVEVARKCVEAPGGFGYHNQYASHSLRTGGTLETFVLGSASNVLAAGTNVLAIQTLWDSIYDNWNAIADLRITGTPDRLLVYRTNIWRYFVGIAEPVGASNEPPEGVDWIELCNRGATSVSLKGWALTDDPNLTAKWQFANGTLKPGEYLVVMADGLNLQATNGAGPHANFALDGGGGTLALLDNSSPPSVRCAFTPYVPQSYLHSFGLADGGMDYRFLARGTPGAPNDTNQTFDSILPAPTITPPQGFYTAPIQVFLSTLVPDVVIRYTRDGTEPTMCNGDDYPAPILLDQPSNAVIRARLFKTGCIPSPVATRTYLINLPAALKMLPALALVGDEQRDLFEPHGVMAISGGYSNWWPANVYSTDANYYHNGLFAGSAYERPVVAALLKPADNTGFQIGAGVRVEGSAGRATRRRGPLWTTQTYKYGLRLYFRPEYDKDRLDYPLFADTPVASFEQLCIRSGFWDDCVNPSVKEELLRRLLLDTGQLASHGTFVNLFINGVFKTQHNLIERPTESFFQDYYGGTNTWEIWKINTYPADRSAWSALLGIVTNTVKYNPQVYSNYLAVASRLDVLNFADYLLVNVYANNSDWPRNNFVMYREYRPGARYRFIPWDSGCSFGYGGAATVMNDTFLDPILSASFLALNVQVCVLYNYLRQTPEFRLLMADRIQRHFFHGGALTDTNVSNRYAALKAMVQPTIMYQQSNYNNDVETNWLPKRRNAIFPCFVGQGIWFTNLVPPEFNLHGGLVTNGFTVSIANANATGAVYFTVDGADPRGITGVVQGLLYTSPIRLTSSITLKARVLKNAAWSALNEAAFAVTNNYAAVRINEVLANAAPPLEDAIELYNDSPEPVNLGGWYLSDATNNLKKFRIPDGTVISGGGYRVFYAFQFNNDTLNPLCFGLDADGEEVHLISPEEPPVRHTAVAFGASEAGVSFGHYVTSDGNEHFVALGALSFGSDVLLTDPPAHSNLFEAGMGAANPPPRISPLVVSEIMYHPAGGGDEFVELYNNSADDLPLANPAQTSQIWRIKDSGGVTYTFAPGIVVPAYTYLVVVGTGVDTTAFRARYNVPAAVPVLGPCMRSLGNSGDAVLLFKPDYARTGESARVLLDEVAYDDVAPWPVQADGAGPSLQRVSPVMFGDEPANWRAGPSGGTPGTDAPEPSLLVAALLWAAARHRNASITSH